ncbi:hypothetical protein CPT_Phriendly_005 [Vibrio phage Phriendly]|nr:hypothetical protein CPT_Phriendly_005 [Vibrio phage Phriendly]
MKINVVKSGDVIAVITRTPVMGTNGQMLVSYQRKWHVINNGNILL